MMHKIKQITKIAMLALSITAIGLIPISQAMADGRHGNRHDDRYNRHDRYDRYDRHNNRRYYGRDRRYSHHRNHGGEVALGILTGGLLFYALTADHRSRKTVYVAQQPVHVQPPQQQWTQQQTMANSACLQVREYQTTITVGNKNVPAYGQSCLQPDGSWKIGPAIPESN